MSTLNVDIYEKSISSLNDPYITAAYNNTPIDFFKIMYNYMVNGIPFYNNPVAMVALLNDRTEPSGVTEIFDGGIINYVLTSIPSSSAYFSYKVSDIIVEGSFDYATNSATLAATPVSGTDNVEIEWYDAGQFNQTLSISQQRIVSMFLVSSWAEKEKNFLLDIRRLLNDTDFNFSAEAPNINAKGNWFYSMREQAEKQMMQDSWIVFYNAKKSLLSS